jgi:hypothetical protein
MKNILFYLSIILFLSNCREDDQGTTEIFGVVKDFYSEENTPNVIIWLQNIINDPSNPQFVQSNPYDSKLLIDFIACDSAGYFSSIITGLKKGTYKIVLLNDTMISVEAYNIEIGRQNQIDMLVKRLFYFRLNIKNLNNQYDKIVVDINNDQKIISNFHFIGYAIDTSVILGLIPDIECEISYNLYTEEQFFLSKDTILYLARENDTLYHLIEY